MTTIQDTITPKPRKGRVGDYSNPGKPQQSNMPQKYKDMIAQGKDKHEVFKMWEDEVAVERLKEQARAKAQWIKDHPELWEAMQPKKKTGFFASLVSFGYDLLGKGAEALIKNTIGEIPIVGGKIGDYLGGKAREGLESAGQIVREGIPMRRGGRIRRSYLRGGRVGGRHSDYESEVDTIPAKLEAGEMVLPRVYKELGEEMLRKGGLPLPIPSKVEKVMHEFKHHHLHDSHGHLVHNRKQAVAIALNVARHYKK